MFYEAGKRPDIHVIVVSWLEYPRSSVWDSVQGKIDDRKELQNITLTRIVVNAGSAAFNLYTKMTPAEIMSLMTK